MAPSKPNPLRKIGKQIQAIMSTHPGNTPKQKQPTEAKVIGSHEDVPATYQEFFRSHSSRAEVFPYAILTPTYETPDGRITGKLLCAIDHTFYVLEEDETGVVKVCYPIDEINYVEVTHTPSDLFVRIDGHTHLGVSSSSIFGSSKTNDKIFTPLFQRIRLRINSLNEKAPSRHLERLNRWNDAQARVMDMARHCLLPGETVIYAILQTEIRRTLQGVKSPSHTCILTDKELVLIREDPSQGRKEPRLTICNFIPLNKIDSLTTNRENDLLTVDIRQKNGQAFKPLFDISLENEVDQFMARTRKLMPKERTYIRDAMNG